MTEQSKRQGIGFWSTIVVVVRLGYLLSAGPACCISSGVGGERVVTFVYRPLTLACRLFGDGETAEESKLTRLFRTYTKCLAPEEWFWTSEPDSWEWVKGRDEEVPFGIFPPDESPAWVNLNEDIDK